jgi:hypothetical protein
MPRIWKCALRVTQKDVKLLVSSPEQGDLVKARLDPQPRHPRALLTTLEGLSLWSGHPLSVALYVEERSPYWPGAALFGDELWPAESQLVRFEVAHRVRRHRLRGLGNFRSLREDMP